MPDSIYETIGRNYVRREFMRRQHDGMRRLLIKALLTSPEDYSIGRVKQAYEGHIDEPSENDLLKFAQTIR
jgi:hypothetical protein